MSMLLHFSTDSFISLIHINHQISNKKNQISLFLHMHLKNVNLHIAYKRNHCLCLWYFVIFYFFKFKYSLFFFHCQVNALEPSLCVSTQTVVLLALVLQALCCFRNGGVGVEKKWFSPSHILELKKTLLSKSKISQSESTFYVIENQTSFVYFETILTLNKPVSEKQNFPMYKISLSYSLELQE